MLLTQPCACPAHLVFLYFYFLSSYPWFLSPLNHKQASLSSFLIHSLSAATARSSANFYYPFSSLAASELSSPAHTRSVDRRCPLLHRRAKGLHAIVPAWPALHLNIAPEWPRLLAPGHKGMGLCISEQCVCGGEGGLPM
jgi:hypothetical protein